jgi:hypothetical protein
MIVIDAHTKFKTGSPDAYSSRSLNYDRRLSGALSRLPDVVYGQRQFVTKRCRRPPSQLSKPSAGLRERPLWPSRLFWGAPANVKF